MTGEEDEGLQRINMDLAEPPTDPSSAENYRELFDLLRLLNDSIRGGRMSQAEFAVWDAKAHSLLHPSEIARLEKPLRPHIPNL
jgi:hypothetical protein